MIGRLQKVASALRISVARASGIEIGGGCRMESEVTLRRSWSGNSRGEIQIGENCELENGVLFQTYGGNIRLGSRVFVGPYTVIYGHGGVEIGDHTLIAMHCRIVSSNHAIPPMGTTIRSQADQLRPTKIGRDVWLGAGVTVLGGIIIGDGAIVGAGAVVTKNIPAGSITLGTPATVKGWREDAPQKNIDVG
ncbi:MAG: acyltransferase [Chthoniobacterales bacterium]